MIIIIIIVIINNNEKLKESAAFVGIYLYIFVLSMY